MPTLSLPHLTHAPQAGPAAHPTLICLHGRGSHEGDLIDLAQFIAPHVQNRLLWISPRAPLTLMDGYEWYRLLAYGVPEPASFRAAQSTLDTFITEALAAYPIDPAQLFLLGFSQGSMMSYTFALEQPRRVAGVVAQSGYLPLNAGIHTDEAGVRDKPFLITHGTEDNVIPIAWAREAHAHLQTLHAAVEYHEFPNGHFLTEASLNVVARWLVEQIGEQ